MNQKQRTSASTSFSLGRNAFQKGVNQLTLLGILLSFLAGVLVAGLVDFWLLPPIPPSFFRALGSPLLLFCVSVLALVGWGAWLVWRQWKQSQEWFATLDENYSFLETAFEHPGLLLVVLDKEGRIRHFNQACEELTQYRAEEIGGQFLWQHLLLPEERDAVSQVSQLLFSSDVGRYTNHWIAKDGGRYLIDWYNTPVKGEDGELNYIISIGIDVTEQKRLEVELKYREEAHSHAERIAHIGSWDWDLLVGTLHWTDEIYRIFGWEPNSCTANYDAFLEAIHPYDRQIVTQAVSASLESPETPYDIEYRVLLPNQSIRVIHERGRVFCDEENQPVRIVGTVHDITAQKKDQNEIQRLASIVKYSRDFIGITDAAGHALFLNEPGQELVGSKKRGHLAPPKLSDFLAGEERELLMQKLLHQVVHEGRWAGEIDFRHVVSQEPIPVWLELFRIDDSSTGELINLGVVARDMRESKRVEAELGKHREHLEKLVQERTLALETAQEELVLRERMATLGQITATVSHELRNPLGAMRLALYILEREKVDYSEQGKKALSQLTRNIARCDHIIEELLDYTRIHNLQCQELDFDSWLVQILEEQPIPASIRIEHHLQLEQKLVSFDPNRLRRVVINVYENACQALEEVKKKREDTEPLKLKIKTYSQDMRIWFEFSDNGPGIPEDIILLIFEPLYSTKNFGVGLGLPVVKQIMEKHNGGVEVVSPQGLGTTVKLWLPETPCTSTRL